MQMQDPALKIKIARFPRMKIIICVISYVTNSSFTIEQMIRVLPKLKKALVKVIVKRIASFVTNTEGVL